MSDLLTRSAIPRLSTRRSARKEGVARMTSVDALRGFDMFWIAGGSLVVSALERAGGSPLLSALKTQLTHVEWEGFRFYDLIFPLFVFLVGVSIALAIPKSLEKRGRAGTVKHIFTRGILLFVIGVIYSGGISGGWDDVRWLGVLNRIALCYTATALLFTFLRVGWLVPIAATILLGYWGMMAIIPIRDIKLDKVSLEKLSEKRGGETNVFKLYADTTERISGQFDPGYNVANHFDFRHLPGRRYDTFYDPEGILSTLPAIVTCLLGLFAGRWINHEKYAPSMRALGLIVMGFLFMALGYLWGFNFPVIKKIWTSSYVLVAGGYSLMLLGAFYQVIDVWGYRAWCQPFVWIGANALTIYLAARFLGFGNLAQRVAGGPIKAAFGPAGDIVVAFVAVGLLFWFARFLYRRQIFLKL